MRRFLLLCTLALLGGCSLRSPGQARASVSAWLPPPLGPEMLRVDVSDGRRTWTLQGRDFESPGGWQFRGPEIRTRTSGTLRVRYTLAAPDRRVVSAGEVELPLRPDWRWGVDVHADSANPTRLCFGCTGFRVFPLDAAYRSARADSVYVVWGGNSIRNPAVY